MYLTLAIHLAVGLAGSLAFGHAVAPNVLDSLPQVCPTRQRAPHASPFLVCAPLRIAYAARAVGPPL